MSRVDIREEFRGCGERRGGEATGRIAVHRDQMYRVRYNHDDAYLRIFDVHLDKEQPLFVPLIFSIESHNMFTSRRSFAGILPCKFHRVGHVPYSCTEEEDYQYPTTQE